MRLSPPAVALLVLLGTSARAEIAVLSNGQTLKLEGHRLEEGLVVLVLKGGGEMGVPPDTVRGFVPDEVLEEVAVGPGGDLREVAAQVALRHGLDPGLVIAVVSVESGFRPQAVSPKGAQGLMQLMPATAESLGVVDAFDPEQNLDGGVRHLGQLLTQYDGDLERALAAYNAGAGAVHRHHGVPPYRETRAYVRKVLQRYRSHGEQREADADGGQRAAVGQGERGAPEASSAPGAPEAKDVPGAPQARSARGASSPAKEP